MENPATLEDAVVIIERQRKEIAALRRRLGEDDETGDEAKVVELYHTILSRLPRVRQLTAKRKSAIRGTWKALSPRGQTMLQFWEHAFRAWAKQDWIFGSDRNNWVADFDYVTRRDAVLRNLEKSSAPSSSAASFENTLR